MATTATEEPTISQGGKISTFDKISGAQASLNSSTATNLFHAYNSGQMTPGDAQAYEAHVKAGEIMLPRGETLKGEAAGETAAPTAQGAARELSMSVWKAYGSNAMSPEDRISLEKHVKLGHVAPPVDFVMDQTKMPETTLGGIGSAIARGVAPALPMAAAGAGIGAALGAPIAGVGAIPGAAAGALVGAGTSLLADPLTEAFNKLTGGHVGMPTEAIQQLLSHFGVQVPDTAIERVMQSMAGGALAGVSGAGAAKVIGGALGMAPMALNAASKVNKVAPTLTRFAAEMAEAPVAQAIAGAGAGGSAQIAAEHGAGPGMQLAAGLLGGAATGVASTMHHTGPNAADLAGRQLAAEGEQFKIPVLTSDVSPPRTFVGKNLQAAGERVPITGTGPLRAAQQEARINAVREFVQEHGGASAAEAVEEVTANLLATHGEKLNKYNGKKIEVINRLSTNAAVPTPNAIAEIDKQINFLSSLKLNEFKPAIAILEDWKQASQGQNLSNIEVLRKQIGNVFQAPELASVRDTSSKALSSIYHAINEDMGEFILANGERRDFAKWKIANLRLAELKGEVNDKAVLEQILNKGEATPELVRKMLFSTKPSDVRVLYSKLSRQGKTSAQSAIIAEAAEKATTDGVIIPDRFSSGVDKLSSQFGVFFPGDAKRKVDGLVSVLRATKRAGAAAAHPPTGVQVATVGSALAAGHIAGTTLGGVSLLGGAGGLARLYESAPVRNLLLRLPHVRIGSAEDSAIMQRINNAAAKNAPPPPAGSPPHGSPPGTPPVAPHAPPTAPPAAPAVAPPVAPAIAPAAPAVAPTPVAAPVAAAIAKRPLSPFASEGIAPPVSPFASEGIAPPGKPVPALKRVPSPFALNEPLPIPRPNPFATDGIIRKPPSPFVSEGIAPPYAKDAAPVTPAAARAEAAVQKANVAKVNALTDSQARYVARSLGFGHMPEHLKEVLKQTHPEDLAKALENVPAVAKEKPAAAATPAAASMKLLPEVSESSAKAAKAAENKRLVMEAKAKKASPAGAEAIQLPATETPLPERTYDTMSDAIALSSPSGKMSKTSRDAAEKRLGEKLFGEGGMPAPSHPQPLEQVSLRRQAAELDRLAEGGMKPKAFRQDAENLRKRADALDNAAGIEATAKAPAVEAVVTKTSAKPAKTKNDTEHITVFRAGDKGEVGIKPFSSFSENKKTAEAYTDNPGFGGQNIREIKVPKGKILEANVRSRPGMVELAKSIGLTAEEGESWIDNGWQYPWEESSKVKKALEQSGYDWVSYVDDFPQGAKTIVPLKMPKGWTQRGNLWHPPDASAVEATAKVNAEYKVNEAANAVKQKAVEEAKAVERAEQARIYNEKISLEGEKTIRSSSSANYNVGIRDGKDGISVIKSRIYTKESMPGVELLAWKASDGWRTAEKKTGMGVSGVATSSAKKALDKGFEAIRAKGGSERIKKMIKSGDFKILNPETGIEATAQAPSVVIKGNK